MTETPSPELSSDSSQTESSPFDFDQFLADAEEKIATLKARRQAVKAGKIRHQSLIKNRVASDTLKDIKATEVIEADLEKIEYELATELIEIVGEENLIWKGQGETFWTFFRYAGIGFAIAVVLHKLVG